jgi:hypothetical protein
MRADLMMTMAARWALFGVAFNLSQRALDAVLDRVLAHVPYLTWLVN